MIPVCVPSKARPKSSTLRLLAGSGVAAHVYVEQDDERHYCEQWGAFHKVQVLPESNRGLAYARQHIMGQYDSWHWQIDDDMESFSARTGVTRKSKACKINYCIAKAEWYLRELSGNFVMVGLGAKQYDWTRNKSPILIDKFCNSFFCIHSGLAKRNGIRFGMNGKEDKYFAIQCLEKGLHTARLTELLYACPVNGSNQGGLHSFYADKKLPEQVAQAIHNMFPKRTVLTVNRMGRIDINLVAKRRNN